MASALAVALMRACWHDQPTLSVKRKQKRTEERQGPIQGPIGWRWDLLAAQLSPQTSGAVVPKVDSTIYWINHYPLDSAVGFPNTYPLGTDLSGDSPIHLLNNPGQICRTGPCLSLAITLLLWRENFASLCLSLPRSVNCLGGKGGLHELHIHHF